MDPSDEKPTRGPSAATPSGPEQETDHSGSGSGPRRASSSYRAPSIPTLADRRAHLKRLALWATGAATVTTGVYVAAQLANPPQLAGAIRATGPQPVEQDPSWLQEREDPQDYPRLAGELVAPELEYTPQPCTLPPEPEQYPSPDGGMPAPDLPQPSEGFPDLPGDTAVAQPDPAPPRPAGAPPAPEVRPGEDPEPPRIKGKVAMPRHPVPEPAPEPEPPRMRGRVAVPRRQTTKDPAPLPPRGGSNSTLEGQLRSVYLTGTTSEGEAFSVMLRLEPGDEDSYQAVIRARRAILAGLAPLASRPELAKGQAALNIVRKLVPGAEVRGAGVVR